MGPKMADIVHMRKDEEPPENEGWVLVDAIPSGRTDGGPVTHTKGATFYVVPPKSRDDTIADAVAWADKHGIKLVFVRGHDA
jgi:hypothetical protein